jgi:hypothetical protein
LIEKRGDNNMTWKNTIKKNDMESYEREQLRREIESDAKDGASLAPNKNVDKKMLNKVENLVSEALKMLNDSMNLRIDPVKQNTLRAEAIEKLKEVLLFTQ